MTIADQPPPVQNEGRPIWELVIVDVSEASALFGTGAMTSLLVVDMRTRDRTGRERYGTPLQANNGRDYLVDAYQEALDLSVYLRQGIAEKSEPTALDWRDYRRALSLVVSLRTRIYERDGQ